MARLAAQRLTSRVFYGLVAVWVIGIILGMILGLPYVGRNYAGVTLPIFLGLLACGMTLGNLCSGAIWRGRHRAIARQSDPVAYWIAVAVLAAISVLLLVIGIGNWMALP